jgi:hypothetical protein
MRQVRILEGGKKIVAKEDSFYDSEVLKNITADWQKATKSVKQHTSSYENKDRRCVYYVADETIDLCRKDRDNG